MTVPKKAEPEPGEWQQEPGLYGRRFRMIGGVKEYEMDINGVPESVFFASQKANAERRKAEIERERREALERAAQRRKCPFAENSGDCSREKCALFINGSCTLSQIVGRPAADTAERQCPFSKYKYACIKDCALYNGGCTLTSVILVKKGE